MCIRRSPSTVSIVLCSLFVPIVVLVAAGGCSNAPGASSESAGAARSPDRTPVDSMDSYYLSRCAVCDAQLGVNGEAIDFSFQGRGLRVCCQACRTAFAAAPAAKLARLDAIMIADQASYYPLSTSLLDGRALGDRPVEFIWGNRLFRAVDRSEQNAILADPVSAISKLDRAVIAAQQPVYGMPEKCPVQGDILPDDRKIDIVVANRMIRVCCGRCARVVQSRPYQYLAMVEYANRQAASSRR